MRFELEILIKIRSDKNENESINNHHKSSMFTRSQLVRLSCRFSTAPPVCAAPQAMYTQPRPGDCRVASDGGRNNTGDYTICCHTVGLATSMMQDRLPSLRNYRQRTNRFPEKISCVFITSGPESCSGTTTMRLNVEEPQSSDAVLHQFLQVNAEEFVFPKKSTMLLNNQKQDL